MVHCIHANMAQSGEALPAVSKIHDVIVVGAGITGAATAYRLRQAAGANVLLVDRHGDDARTQGAENAERAGVGRLFDHDRVPALEEGVEHQLDRLLVIGQGLGRLAQVQAGMATSDQGGRVVGRTDSLGMAVKERPVTVQDFYATMYSCPGVDTHKEFLGESGRPIQILDKGEPVVELL